MSIFKIEAALTGVNKAKLRQPLIPKQPVRIQRTKTRKVQLKQQMRKPKFKFLLTQSSNKTTPNSNASQKLSFLLKFKIKINNIQYYVFTTHSHRLVSIRI